ncbi:MAG TPA: GNAT family N-acetyltransferase [Candidatus Baltobacteraceae bacterium]|nr:GNAT family N-acetyltransferase [Candidatus Baltobacteraceae bacterium]
MTVSAPPVVVRRPTAADPPRIAAMVAALSARSLERRFLGTVPRSEAIAELRREIEPGDDSIAFVACDAGGSIVGEAYAALFDGDGAEVAFAVADGWQGRGVGTALRRELFTALRRRGIRYAVAELLWSNAAMLSLLRDAKLPVAVERCEEGVLVMRVDLGALLTP